MTSIDTPQGDLPLDEARVEVWYVRVGENMDDALLARYRAVLNAEERARADRFVFAVHRRLYTVAHALLRHCLSRYLPRSPEGWQFLHNAYGKPELVADQNSAGLRFNLTHTQGLAACAITRGHDVGVDAENARRRDVSEAIARRYFAEPEVAALMRLPAAERREVFFHYWTLKEAYIKARGLGLAIPLDRFWFDLAAGEPIRIGFHPELEDEPAAWRFTRWNLESDFIISVALRDGARTVSAFELREAVF